MQLRSFNSSGVFGDPRPATAATGEKIIGHIVARSLAAIRDWEATL
jgi:creatinine amidohydrolase